MLSYRLAFGIQLASRYPNQPDKTRDSTGHREGSWTSVGPSSHLKVSPLPSGRADWSKGNALSRLSSNHTSDEEMHATSTGRQHTRQALAMTRETFWLPLRMVPGKTTCTPKKYELVRVERLWYELERVGVLPCSKERYPKV